MDLMRKTAASSSFFSAIISVGPDPVEVMRVIDLISYLLIFEDANLEAVVVVDDSRGRHDYRPIIELSTKIKVLASPRRGSGDGWRGGLTVNVLCALREALKSTTTNIVLKFDTDTMVIGPFFHQLTAAFDLDVRIGILGSCFRYDLHGTPVAKSTWLVNLSKHKKRVRLRRRPYPHIEFALWGRRATHRALLTEALSNGWPEGACAQGGCYAVKRSCADLWLMKGWLRDDLLWLHTDLTEDVVLSMLCFAAGYVVADLNGEAGVFGVQYKGLGLSLSEFFDRDLSIIHSVKANSWDDEVAVRARIRAMVKARWGVDRVKAWPLPLN